MPIFANYSPSSSHLHPLQVENCDSNSRLVVDEDDNGKFRPERVNLTPYMLIASITVFNIQSKQFGGGLNNKTVRLAYVFILILHIKVTMVTAIRGLWWIKMTKVNSGLKGLKR